jgi:hypothetical protein
MAVWSGVGESEGFTCVLESSLGPYPKQPRARLNVSTATRLHPHSHFDIAIRPTNRIFASHYGAVDLGGPADKEST